MTRLAETVGPPLTQALDVTSSGQQIGQPLSGLLVASTGPLTQTLDVTLLEQQISQL
jgi:hypothetical protein